MIVLVNLVTQIKSILAAHCLHAERKRNLEKPRRKKRKSEGVVLIDAGDPVSELIGRKRGGNE